VTEFRPAQYSLMISSGRWSLMSGCPEIAIYSWSMNELAPRVEQPSITSLPAGFKPKCGGSSVIWMSVNVYARRDVQRGILT
jgi:hypothetical protein